MSSRPSDESSAFRAFQERLRAGDSDAASELFDDYSRRLIQLASKNIHPALLKRFDGEDVVQSVFRTFFRRHEEGSFRIEHSQQLWQLLVTLTLYKTRSQARKHTAEKRNAKVDQEMTEQEILLDGRTSPEEALALWEEIDFVLNGLPDRAAEIISMRLEGSSSSEIAKKLSLTRQTIHRILKLIESRLQQRFDFFAESGNSRNETKEN